MTNKKEKLVPQKTAKGVKKSGKNNEKKKEIPVMLKKKLLNGVLQGKLEDSKDGNLKSKEDEKNGLKKKEIPAMPPQNKIPAMLKKTIEQPVEALKKHKVEKIQEAEVKKDVTEKEKSDKIKVEKPHVEEVEKVFKQEEAKKPVEIEEKINTIIKKGKKVIGSIGKRVFTGVKEITKGKQIVVKGTEAVLRRTRVARRDISRKVKIAKLKYGVRVTRKVIRELYTEIGGEVCVLESEGKKIVEIEKGKMKKLIGDVRKYEKKLEKIDTEIVKLRGEVG